MFENYDMRIGKRYIYAFDKRFSRNMQDRMIIECECRFLELCNIIQPITSSWERPYYLFEVVGDGEDISGKTFDGLIQCKISLDHTEDMPMVHEEAHMVAHQKIGRMSYAWSEGFAEYIVAKRSNNIDLLSGKYGDYLRLEYWGHIEVTLKALTSEDADFFNYLRKNNIFYSMSLASMLYYIESKLGIQPLKYVQDLVTSAHYDELKLFLSETVIEQWLSWIGHNRP